MCENCERKWGKAFAALETHEKVVYLWMADEIDFGEMQHICATLGIDAAKFEVAIQSLLAKNFIRPKVTN